MWQKFSTRCSGWSFSGCCLLLLLLSGRRWRNGSTRAAGSGRRTSWRTRLWLRTFCNWRHPHWLSVRKQFEIIISSSFSSFFVLSRANNADLFSTGRFISKAKKFSQLFFASAYILQAPRNFKTWQEGSLVFAVVVLFSSNLVLSQS